MSKGRGKKPTSSTARRKGGPVRRKHSVVEEYNSTSAATSCTITTHQPTVHQPTTQQSIAGQPNAQPLAASVSCKRPSPSSGAFVLTSLKYCDSRVSICYGCNQKMRDSTDFPRARVDLVIVGKMRRKYTQAGQQKLSKETNVYFHPLTECVNKRAPMFIPALLIFHPTDIRETLFVQAHDDFLNPISPGLFLSF